MSLTAPQVSLQLYRGRWAGRSCVMVHGDIGSRFLLPTTMLWASPLPTARWWQTLQAELCAELSRRGSRNSVGLPLDNPEVNNPWYGETHQSRAPLQWPRFPR
ncbi:hypothetical protein PMIN02_009165 [Paraphaeosphaeria minitans]